MYTIHSLFLYHREHKGFLAHYISIWLIIPCVLSFLSEKFDLLVVSVVVILIQEVMEMVLLFYIYYVYS